MALTIELITKYVFNLGEREREMERQRERDGERER